MHSIRKLLHEVQIKKCARIAHYTALRSHFLTIVMLIIYLCRETKNDAYMEKNTFVISDESVNSYGYIVKTDGIDTTAFE